MSEGFRVGLQSSSPAFVPFGELECCVGPAELYSLFIRRLDYWRVSQRILAEHKSGKTNLSLLLKKPEVELLSSDVHHL